MLWKDRNEKDLPPELRGQDPEDVAKRLREAETLKTQIAELTTARDSGQADLASTRTELEALKVKLAELEATPPKPPEPPSKDEPPSIFLDPDRYIDKRTEGIANVALMSGIMSAKMYATQSLTPRDRKIFAKYETEIAKIVDSYAPAQRVLPQIWINALIYTKGMHEADIRKAETDDPGSFAEIPSRGPNEPPPPSDKLTQEELDVCKAMKWDPARYLESKKKGETHGSHQVYR